MTRPSTPPIVILVWPEAKTGTHTRRTPEQYLTADQAQSSTMKIARMHPTPRCGADTVGIASKDDPGSAGCTFHLPEVRASRLRFAEHLGMRVVGCQSNTLNEGAPHAA
jgi:hypothetical protein